MPSPSNFNPDQLHEHFNRVMGATGVSFEDNNRIVRLPSGHRFVAGDIDHEITRFGDEVNQTRINLLNEAGSPGNLWLTEVRTPRGFEDTTASIIMPSGPRERTILRWEEAGEDDQKVTETHQTWDTGKQEILRSVGNPSQSQANELIGKALQFLPDLVIPKHPGRVNVSMYEADVTPEGDFQLGDLRFSSPGQYAFNARTRRYERIPN